MNRGSVQSWREGWEGLGADDRGTAKKSLCNEQGVLLGEQRGGGGVEDLALGFFEEGEGEEFFDVAFDFGDSWAGPVGAPEDFVGNFLDAGKIFEELLRGDAGDVHVHVFVAAYEKESFVHPEGAAAVGEDDDEIGVVDADIVA